MRSEIHLRPGDVFATEGGMGLFSWGIRQIERFNSHDNEATYGHAGIVIDAETILDTLWTVKITEPQRYKGQQIIIARPTRTVSGDRIAESTKKLAIRGIELSDSGQLYPAHRIVLHLVPPIAKYLSDGKRKVCSERTAFFLSSIGARPEPWAGATPDMLADEWRRWGNFEVIYEGVW